MQSRRDFLKAAAALGSASIVWNGIPDAIARAAAIDPDLGTTYHDAEHVVILMQENRSFDHTYGTLRGVRGFRDPRAHQLPNGAPVWFQPDTDGSIVPPFRLDMDGTNITWMGGTPHSWTDQVDARNGGQYDKWLPAKRREDNFPMTMGFFTREDIPFYYALADAFTVFDYAFCSSLTGTTPNRLHLWTGTIREDANHPARVQNGDTTYDNEAAWTTYPERLEKADISWRIYQNEISIDTGFTSEEDDWLGNFTDNPIEWFTQYRVRYSKSRRAYLPKLIEKLPKHIEEITAKLADTSLALDEQRKLEKQRDDAKKYLESAKKELIEYTEDSWRKLPDADRAIHQKAFCINDGDPDFRTLVDHTYDDNGQSRTVQVPKGDVLHQFRKDVESGNLPAVSWLIAPCRFSDHPGSAWFGAWYLSEALNILTRDPEVWKKTVFILCYDENDGLFDHVPPFVAPHPGRPETGKVSKGIDTSLDVSDAYGRDHSIGLGYRCPLVIASPWTRGGCVNSQVSDHTSVLMFLENWLAGKGTPVVEKNISKWRRTVCGDLTSAFKPYNGEQYELPKYLVRDAYIERIHKANFKAPPKPAMTLQPSDAQGFQVAAFQESGARPSCPLPYELEANIEANDSSAKITLEAGNKRNKDKSAGGAFNVYSYGTDAAAGANMICRAYAVSPDDRIEDTLPIEGECHIRIDGPNGFMRELRSSGKPAFDAKVRSEGEDLALALTNKTGEPLQIELIDKSYGDHFEPITLIPHHRHKLAISTRSGKHWYDIAASAKETRYRFAGRIETGQWSISDPAMG
ncbi:MAG: phospholipase C, phosphocholine-specific [Candidatus Hydrogenedentes bacterium]|nr:phospholipase C, phosphocholine-specific [Candidatus Hydrogenedentota bacterium]